jgi:hypothetical protein
MPISRVSGLKRPGQFWKSLSGPDVLFPIASAQTLSQVLCRLFVFCCRLLSLFFLIFCGFLMLQLPV